MSDDYGELNPEECTLFPYFANLAHRTSMKMLILNQMITLSSLRIGGNKCSIY